MTQFVPASRPLLRDILGRDLPVIEICDVGAMTEGTNRYDRLVRQNMANVNGFEPNPAYFKQLQERKTPRQRYFPCFLGKGGPATFHITRYPGCCSLYEPDPALIGLFTSISAMLPGGNFAVVSTEEVTTTRIDDVPDLPPIDYMKLDVQGAELDVLQGGLVALKQATVIELEVEFVPLYKGQPLFGDVQVFLRQHNFVLHKFVDIVGRAFRPLSLENPHAAMSQMLWADAVFVRNFVDLTGYDNEQLLKAAVVLYEIYNSHDLAHRLLREFDRRQLTDCARRFMQSITTAPTLDITFCNVKSHL
jgi:FkbM family methyltransferase